MLHAQLVVERDTVESETTPLRVGLSIERVRSKGKGCVGVRASRSNTVFDPIVPSPMFYSARAHGRNKLRAACGAVCWIGDLRRVTSSN